MEVMLTTHLGGTDNMHSFKHLFRPFSGLRQKFCSLLLTVHTGCHHFPYLLNVVCRNDVIQYYTACGRVLINRQDGISIGKALSKLESIM